MTFWEIFTFLGNLYHFIILDDIYPFIAQNNKETINTEGCKKLAGNSKE